MPSLYPKRNIIEGRREIDGFTIKFTGVALSVPDLFQLKVVDHFGEQTSEIVVAHELYGAIGEMAERAAEASRERAKEMAEEVT